MKKVQEILFSWGEKPLNHTQFVPCPPSIFRHSRQANSAFSGPKFWAGGPKFCTGPLICTSSKFCLVLDLVRLYPFDSRHPSHNRCTGKHFWFHNINLLYINRLLLITYQHWQREYWVLTREEGLRLATCLGGGPGILRVVSQSDPGPGPTIVT